jgi:protein TonB
MNRTSLQRKIATAALALTAAAAIALAAGSAIAQADEEPVPVVRVQPVYPARAISRGETGAVALRFTITADGRTKNIEVVESTARTFEQPAIDALRKWRYDRQSTERQGVQTVLRFQIKGKAGLLPSEQASQ